MDLINKLKTQGSPLSNFGANFVIPNFKDSRIHYTYSINGKPYKQGLPFPSILDLNGNIPKNNYRDNCPEGLTF
jgi:hypothetical protein